MNVRTTLETSEVLGPPLPGGLPYNPDMESDQPSSLVSSEVFEKLMVDGECIYEPIRGAGMLLKAKEVETYSRI